MNFSTQAVHAGQFPDAQTGALSPPIYQTTTYAKEAPNLHKGFAYSRTANPTRKMLEDNLAVLEGAKHAAAFSSGLAATNTVLNLLKKGDHVVAADDMYGGTYRLFHHVFEKVGLTFDYVDTTDAENIRKAMKPETKLVWIETPSNPMLKITDIQAASEVAHAKGAYLAVDSTLATPYLQRPLEFGADLVVHSTTKYLNGHGDVIGGALCMNDDALNEQIKFYQKSVGAVPSPFDCYLVLRGIKTLPLRMDKHSQNAQKIAEFLQSHPKIKNVIYPGLKGHSQHDLAKRQMRNFSGMLAVELNASFETSMRFAAGMKLFTLAEDLGGSKSLSCHPASMTHPSVPRDQRYKVGLSDELIRLSVGIEDADDLIEDLKAALERV